MTNRKTKTEEIADGLLKLHPGRSREIAKLAARRVINAGRCKHMTKQHDEAEKALADWPMVRVSIHLGPAPSFDTVRIVSREMLPRFVSIIGGPRT